MTREQLGLFRLSNPTPSYFVQAASSQTWGGGAPFDLVPQTNRYFLNIKLLYASQLF
jgi:hypothetical protein